MHCHQLTQIAKALIVLQLRDGISFAEDVECLLLLSEQIDLAKAVYYYNQAANVKFGK